MAGLLIGDNNFSTGTLGSGVTFPSGHVIKTTTFSSHFTSNYYFTVNQTTATVITFNTIAMSMTGVAATEGNKLLLTANAGDIFNQSDATYQTNTGFIIDGTFYGNHAVYHSTASILWPTNNIMVIESVPASFTGITISIGASKEGTQTIQMAARGGMNGGYRCTITAQEIQN